MRVVNWNFLENKAKRMTIEELMYLLKDCRLAEKASKGWNPENESYYSDEASVYAMELNRRYSIRTLN